MSNPNPTGGFKPGKSGNPGGKTKAQKAMEQATSKKWAEIRRDVASLWSKSNLKELAKTDAKVYLELLKIFAPKTVEMPDLGEQASGFVVMRANFTVEKKTNGPVSKA